MDTRFERVLSKVKGFRLNFSEKPALDNKDGEDGEFRINKNKNKSDLLVKMGNKWEKITPEAQLKDKGYMKFGNGFIIQWGHAADELPFTSSDDIQSTEIVTFPIPFPNECFQVHVTTLNIGDTGGVASATVLKTMPTRTGVEFSAYTSDDGLYWIAIGY